MDKCILSVLYCAVGYCFPLFVVLSFVLIVLQLNSVSSTQSKSQGLRVLNGRREVSNLTSQICWISSRDKS